ncbi:toxin-antitoxin system HicB family antitoxin [Chloroflexi bacterium TSY]|nr:toxin-antitoxin system HicB family antitoxin [Chloroflexi bacterium TSY]
MATLTIRLPDDKHARLKEIARMRKMSLNRLMEEFSNIAIAEFDAEIRFRAMAIQGSREQGLALLDKLDRLFETQLDQEFTPNSDREV